MLHMLWQWLVGIIVILGGGGVALLVGFLCSPDFEDARGAIFFVLLIGAVVLGGTWAAYEIGGSVLSYWTATKSSHNRENG